MGQIYYYFLLSEISIVYITPDLKCSVKPSFYFFIAYFTF